MLPRAPPLLRHCPRADRGPRPVRSFDADLAGSDFTGANMAQCNLEMADLTGTTLQGADLTNAYVTGAVLKGLTNIKGSDWTDVDMRKDQRSYLCTIAEGVHEPSGVPTKETLMCP